MKYILTTFLLCLLSAPVFPQFLIEEEFNAGTGTAGWTFTSIGTTTTLQNVGKSSPALTFNATNDQVVSPAFSGADQLTFLMICSSGTNATDNMKVEGLNGTWTVLANVKPHSTARVNCITIPAGVTQIRLTYTMGSASNVYVDDVTIRQSGKCTSTSNKPYITGINVDACSSGCEGHDEFFTIRNGNAALNISDIEFSYPNAGTSPSTWCGNSATPCDMFIATNATEVAALNTLAGCTIFSSSATIPANADVMIFNGNPQQQRTNFSGLCGSGKTYYALFANNTNTSSSDGCNGRFGNRNTGCSDCYRGLFLRDRSNGCDDTVSYAQDLINGNDGAMALYAYDGSPANYSSSAASTCAFTVLPVKITSFYVITELQSNTLAWETEGDESIKSYGIEKSLNGTDFYQVGEVSSQRGSTKSAYRYTDPEAPAMNSYYRLRSADIDGNEVYSPIIFAVKEQLAGTVITQDENMIYVHTAARDDESQTIEVMNAMGQKLLSDQFSGRSYAFSKQGLKNQMCYILLGLNGNNVTRRIFAE